MKITHDEFGRYLVDIVNENPASDLFTIPGIWEILSEEYNNEILDRWTADNMPETEE